MEDLVLPLKVAGILVLAFFSAVFSGLNLGLMCLDANQLELLIKAADRDGADVETKQQARWSSKILPLRKDGNMLLCTVLFGNVMVNASMAILLTDFGDGLIAFLISTFIIVTFGEIVPQSLCYKHGLRIGAALVPLLLVVWYSLYPITKPVALALDWCLGEELGQVLDKGQMKALIDYQRKRAPHLLTAEEAKILKGTIDFSTVEVQSIMVPLSDCFCIDANAVINAGLRAAVSSAGYSRIPVLDRDTLAPKFQLKVVGLIHVKDLPLIDLVHEVPLKALMPLIGRQVLVVDDDRPLPEILDEFRTGASQFAVVQSYSDDEDCDPFIKHVGILTLQDLLNTIIQDDFGELDVCIEGDSVPAAPSKMFSNVPKISTAGRSAVQVRGLSNNEVTAVAAFLRERFSSLFHGIFHSELERFLLHQCPVVGGTFEQKYKGSRAFYRRGETAKHAILILTGEVKVFSGREAFESVHGPWSLLAKRCLELNWEKPGQEYAPDFTAYAAEEKGAGTVRLLLIASDAFHTWRRSQQEVRM